jgi:uncharacterized protein YmfQ (DUF2313 family)
MQAPELSAADYAAALSALLPSGRVWPKDSGSTLSALVGGLAQTPARLHVRSLDLLRESFPPTVAEMLPEWESALGLPDPCVGALPTVQQRRAQVVARFSGRGGQSVPYFVNLERAAP